MNVTTSLQVTSAINIKASVDVLYMYWPLQIRENSTTVFYSKVRTICSMLSVKCTISIQMNGVFGHDSARQGYTEPGTT